MEIRQLRMFREVVDAGSISEAARRMNLSQPPLSYHMKMLEQELGVTLFLRGKKNIELTSAGQLLYERAQTLLSLERAVSREVSKEGTKKTLRIGVQDSPRIRELSIQIISEYIKKNNLKPEFIVGEPETLLSKLDSGELDLCSVISFALYGKEHLMTADIGGKKAVPVIVISKEHPLSKKKKLTLRDIKDELIITFDDSFARGSKDRIDDMLQRAGVSTYKMKILKNVQEVKMAVCLNQGVAIELDMAMNDILDKVKLFSIDNLAEEDMARIVIAWKDPKWDDIVSEH